MPVYTSSGFFATKRRSGWNYARRDTWGSANGLQFNWELVNADGAHYHLWVPKTHPNDEAILIRKAVDNLREKYDVVSWSWDYIPEGE